MADKPTRELEWLHAQAVVAEVCQRYEEINHILGSYIRGDITQQETLDRLVDICKKDLMPVQ